ncbi:hypothetical protein [Treponema sp.]
MGGSIGKFSMGIMIAAMAVLYVLCVAVITISEKIKKRRDKKSLMDSKKR